MGLLLLRSRVVSGNCDVLGTGGLEECKESALGYQHFAFACDSESLKAALTDIGANARLTYLKILRRLFNGKQVSGLQIHAGAPFLERFLFQTRKRLAVSSREVLVTPWTTVTGARFKVEGGGTN